MDLGANIYKFRTQKNMSQGDLADTLDVSRQSVSKWENNSAVPELEKLIKMAQFFGITLDELVSGEEANQATPPPQAAPAAPATSQQWHGRYTVGMLLITFGILVCILFVILEFLFSDSLWGIGIGITMIGCGICCWTIEKNTALACGWVVYLAAYTYATIISGGLSLILSLNTASIVTILLLSYGAALSVGTLIKLWRGEITQSLPLKILVTLLIVAMLFVTVWLLLPSQVQTLTPVDPTA